MPSMSYCRTPPTAVAEASTIMERDASGVGCCSIVADASDEFTFCRASRVGVYYVMNVMLNLLMR